MYNKHQSYVRSFFLLTLMSTTSVPMAQSANTVELVSTLQLPKKMPLFKWYDSKVGCERIFRQLEVDGSQGNCGFTAIGIDRENAISLLEQNAEDEQTRKLIAPEIKALVTEPQDTAREESYMQGLPPILQALRQRFHHEYGDLVVQLESQRADLNESLELEGEAAFTFEQMQAHLNENLERYDWGNAFLHDFIRLRQIDTEMEEFLPSAQQLIAFVRYEFGDRHGYLSYFGDGGGALEAIARLRGIEITVLVGADKLTQTLYVKPNADNPHKYFLHHVGGVDSKGRGFLNHFNLLEEIDELAQLNTDDCLSSELDSGQSPDIPNSLLHGKEKMKSPECFICHAIHKEDDAWVDRFERDLDQAGIITYYWKRQDERGCPFGGDIEQFINNIGVVNYIFVICTPELKRKYDSKKAKVCREINTALRIAAVKNNLIPILIRRTWEESIPANLGSTGGLNFLDSQGYKSKFKKLLNYISRNPLSYCMDNTSECSEIDILNNAKDNALSELHLEKKPIEAPAIFPGINQLEEDIIRPEPRELAYGETIRKQLHWAMNNVILNPFIYVATSFLTVFYFYANYLYSKNRYPGDIKIHSVTLLNNFYVPVALDAQFIESSPKDAPSFLDQLWTGLNSDQSAYNSISTFAIVGPPGTGKTQLAAKYVQRAQEKNVYNFVYWVHSETKYNVINSYKRIIKMSGSELSLMEDTENESQFELMKEEVARVLNRFTKGLLIFDNLESVSNMTLIPSMRNAQILITSRDITGFKPKLVLQKFQPDDALMYFLKTMNIETPTEDEKQYALKLAKELGYLPLALSHAARYIDSKNFVGGVTTYLKNFQAQIGTEVDKLIEFHTDDVLKNLSDDLKNCPADDAEQKEKILSKIITYADQTHQYPFTIGITWGLSKKKLENNKFALKMFSYICYCEPDEIPIELFLSRPEENEEIIRGVAELERYGFITRVSAGDNNLISMHRFVQLAEKRKAGEVLALLKEMVVYWLTFLEDKNTKLANQDSCEDFNLSSTYVGYLLSHARKAELHLAHSITNESDVYKDEGYAISITFKALKDQIINYQRRVLTDNILFKSSLKTKEQKIYSILQSQFNLNDADFTELKDQVEGLLNESKQRSFRIPFLNTVKQKTDDELSNFYQILELLAPLDKEKRDKAITFIKKHVPFEMDIKDRIEILKVVSNAEASKNKDVPNEIKDARGDENSIATIIRSPAFKKVSRNLARFRKINIDNINNQDG